MSFASNRKSPTLVVGTPSPTGIGTAAAEVLRNPVSNVIWIALETAKQRIDKLSGLSKNWDSYGSEKPDPKAIEHARVFLEGLFQAAAETAYGWASPHVSANESGFVVLEWWQGSKKITLYVTGSEVKYVLVWGEDIDTEMHESEGISHDEFKDIWSWLHS
jgi:hypothetical protein